MSDNLIRQNREGIRTSDFFLALGTKNYAKGIADPTDENHHLIVEQISYAKSLKKPTVLFLGDSVDSEDERVIREALRGMEIVSEVRFKEGNHKSREEAVLKMKKSLEERQNA